MRRAAVSILLITASAAFAAEPSAATSRAKILIGPNILVSRDGDVPHVELIVAASPRTSKNLIGAAITATRPNGGWACRTYSSSDGGSSWKASEFAEQVEFGGGDPQVVFSNQGTALFVALTMNKNEKGRDCASMHVWRSEDGGMRWLPATEIPCAHSWDHEQIVVDTTKGRYSGRIYLAALYDYPVYRVGVFRSDDDGRTWIGPVEAANGGGTIGINDVTPMVLSDGTLIVPYGDFEFLPEKRKATGTFRSNLWTVSSTDGGVTYTAPRKAQTSEINLDDKSTDLAGFPKFAADVESKEHLDTIYTAWEDYRLGAPRILFSRSADRGKTWSPAQAVDNAGPAKSRQWQPAIAVNRNGVVAATWFDTRDSAAGNEYHEYFAASLDGGRSFLPSVRVSSAASNAHGSGNSQIAPAVFVHNDVVALSFLSAASRWASGGDYMGLAADKDGVFHPFWADARTGTFQVYTAGVTVELPPAKTEAPATAAAPAPPARSEASLVGKVEFIFDPTRLDSEHKQVEIPMRLKNVSSQPIYPPIRVEITGFGFPEYESADDKKRNAENAPSALNSSNQKPKEGAIFDFSGALGTLEALEPGAQTNPVVLRFQLVDPGKTPNLRLKPVGMVPAAP